MKLKYFIPALLAFGMLACSEEKEQIITPEAPDEEQTDASQENDITKSLIPTFASDAEFSDEELATGKRMNGFAFRFFNEAVKTELGKSAGGNIAVSPVSAQYVLTLLANAADESTTDEILRMLGAESLPMLNSTSNKLMRYLSSRASGTIIDIGNSVWCAKDADVSESFVKTVSDNLFAECHGVDFADASTLDLINQWGSKWTHGMIPNFLTSFPDTDVILLNALIFGGEWVIKFEKAETREMTFHGTDGPTTVPMMHAGLLAENSGRPDGKAGYLESELYHCAVCDFKYGATLYALMPKDGRSIEECAKSFSIDDFNALKMNPNKEIILDFPRFKLSTDINLSATLSALGLPAAVSFDKMGLHSPLPFESMQKTEIDLDEDGARIAAITSGWSCYNIPEKNLEIIHLVFDRPFMFLICATNMKSIIMAGVVNNL